MRPCLRRFSAVGEEVAGTLKINVESIMDLKEMETGRLRFVPDDDYGIPTPPSSLFLGRFSPVLRRFSAVLLR